MKTRRHDLPPRRFSPGLLSLGIVLSFLGGLLPVSSETAPAPLPWNLAALSTPPSFEWVPRRETRVRALRYAGLSYGGKPTEVFAYYASPVTLGLVQEPPPGGFPGVVLVHGGGGTAYMKWAVLWAKRGYAAIAMDLVGTEPPDTTLEENGEDKRELRLPSPHPGPGDDAKFGKIAGPIEEQWTYHAVADIVLGHSLLRSLPGVDGGRIAVTGISWGGYLTCIAAAVDPRFKAAVPVYGCGFYATGTIFGEPTGALGRMTEADRARWMSLWDPSRYLPRLRAPIFFLNGTNDRHFYLEGYRDTYDAVASEKDVRLEVNMAHSHPAGWAPQEIGVFLDSVLRGGDPLPRLGAARRTAEGVSAPVASPVPLRSARLLYSTDAKPNVERRFSELPASVSADGVAAPPLPDGTTVWFLEVVDARGMMVTTPPELVGRRRPF